MRLKCNLSNHIMLAVLQSAQGAFGEAQPRPASPSHGSVSQAAAAVIAAPTAGVPARQADATAREALQAEVSHLLNPTKSCMGACPVC